ncbi:MAG: hypothetical protein ABR950_09540 [Candidatus Dormibacteria bacterium]
MQPIAAAERAYAASEGDGAPLSVAQFPGTSASDGATHLGAQVTVDVGGSPGIFEAPVDPTTGIPMATSLTWSAAGWVFVLSSLPEMGYQQPLGEAELVGVAAGVVPTEAAPQNAQAGW